MTANTPLVAAAPPRCAPPVADPVVGQQLVLAPPGQPKAPTQLAQRQRSAVYAGIRSNLNAIPQSLHQLQIAPGSAATSCQKPQAIRDGGNSELEPRAAEPPDVAKIASRSPRLLKQRLSFPSPHTPTMQNHQRLPDQHREHELPGRLNPA